MENLELYEKVRDVPENAQKTIQGGRLKGMTDINPMWRIKTLTEQFGICGIGWKPRIVRTWLDNGVNNEVTANVEIELFIKVDGAWSDAIPGIGGSKFVSKETSGLYTDDECYKKAYTDALSVACKSLGMGADVYWNKDNTKYSEKGEGSQSSSKARASKASAGGKSKSGKSKWAQVNEIIKDSAITLEMVSDWLAKKKYPTKINNLTDEQFNELVGSLNKTLGADNE